MSHVADTSFLVAVFDRADARHAKSRQELAKANPVLIPTEILVEMLGVIKAKAGRSAADDAVEDLVRLPNVLWGETCDFAESYRIYQQESPLSFPDAIFVQQCLSRDLAPLSFDEDQLKVIERRRRKP